MAQGITLRFTNLEDEWPAGMLRHVGWQAKTHLEASFPALGDITVEVFDTTDFDFGRSTGKEDEDGKTSS